MLILNRWNRRNISPPVLLESDVLFSLVKKDKVELHYLQWVHDFTTSLTVHVNFLYANPVGRSRLTPRTSTPRGGPSTLPLDWGAVEGFVNEIQPKRRDTKVTEDGIVTVKPVML